jgi:hypothetical protein
MPLEWPSENSMLYAYCPTGVMPAIESGASSCGESTVSSPFGFGAARSSRQVAHGHASRRSRGE